jgi:hypothetical protein
MKFLSHTHINGNGTKHRREYVRILTHAAKAREYTHVAIGCHGNYIADKNTLMIPRMHNIIPVRFAELNLQVTTPLGSFAGHVSIINIPEQQVEGYTHIDHKTKTKGFTEIADIKPYANKVGAKLVLNHPKSITHFIAFSPYLDGVEVSNGAHKCRQMEVYTKTSLKQDYPDLVQFNGADYHVWKAKGNLDYYTKLPDNWLGKIHW